MIQITIPYRLLLLGKLLRMHFASRTRESRVIAWQIKAAMLNAGYPMPVKPFERARVEVTRYSSLQPDQDNLVASAKMLLDVLQPLSKRHPTGLGFILNDSPAHLEFVAKHQHCDRGTHRTDILIDRLA